MRDSKINSVPQKFYICLCWRLQVLLKKTNKQQNTAALKFFFVVFFLNNIVSAKDFYLFLSEVCVKASCVIGNEGCIDFL